MTEAKAIEFLDAYEVESQARPVRGRKIGVFAVLTNQHSFRETRASKSPEGIAVSPKMLSEDRESNIKRLCAEEYCVPIGIVRVADWTAKTRPATYSVQWCPPSGSSTPVVEVESYATYLLGLSRLVRQMIFQLEKNAEESLAKNGVKVDREIVHKDRPCRARTTSA